MPEALRDEVNHLRAMRKRLKADLRAVLDIHGALLRGDEDTKLEVRALFTGRWRGLFE